MMTSSNGNIFRITGHLYSLMNSPHKGQWDGALMISLIFAWINGWINNGEAGDLRRRHDHYDVTVMYNGTALYALDHKKNHYNCMNFLIFVIWHHVHW